MDDESQRLGLLPLPIRKTQLTYDRAPPLVVLVSFSHCAYGTGFQKSTLHNLNVIPISPTDTTFST